MTGKKAIILYLENKGEITFTTDHSDKIKELLGEEKYFPFEENGANN